MSTARVVSAPRHGRPRPWWRVLVPLAVLVVLAEVVARASTSWQWYRSLGFESVFTTTWTTRALLFVVVGLLDFAWLAGNARLAFRMRPGLRDAGTSPVLLQYRSLVDARHRAMLLPAALVALWGAMSAAAQAPLVLAWLHRTPFGVRDPYFGRDLSFFVFTMPLLRHVLDHALTMAVLGLVVAAATHVAVGGLQGIRGLRQRTVSNAGAHLGMLVAVLLVLLGLSALLGRPEHEVSATSLFTGVGYTDEHVRFGAGLVVAVICFVCAALFAANAWLRRWALAWASLVLLLVSSIVLMGIYPAVVQRFHVRPNVPGAEGHYVATNIAATRAAYRIDGVQTTDDYTARSSADAGQLRSDAAALPAIRLVDPALVAPTFDALQQARRFYAFPQDLDVDHYVVRGTSTSTNSTSTNSTDAVVAAREIDPDQVPDKSWSNVHTVYTHGYGVVAAHGNRTDSGGQPVWLDTGTTATGALRERQPRIYFGEKSRDYVVVGAPRGTQPVELDTPDLQASGVQQLNTYDGGGGVAVGGLASRVAWALTENDLNLAISSRVNSASRILTDREPADRVRRVAPWLTPDSDPYPTVVDGHVLWVVDGYTTTANYPNSQQVDWRTATSDSTSSSRPGVPGATVNYVRNAVKATVDAYTGRVTLYGWDETDPILRTWEKVYPGLVQPKAAIPRALLAHLRYPQDLFTVQRSMLARYHTTDPNDFIQKSDLWQVPDDPTRSGDAVQPPYYLSVRWPGTTRAAFSLTSVYTPTQRQNMIAYMAVDADASSPGYGTMRVLRMSDAGNVPGPSQTFGLINTNGDVAAKLRPYTGQGASAATYANLMTLPVGGGLLYVQPVYTQVSGSLGSYPVMRFVVARFGSRVGIGDTLQQALDDVFGAAAPAQPTTPGGTPARRGSAAARQLLAQASAAFAKADAALRAGDLAEYQAQVALARARTQAAIDALK